MILNLTQHKATPQQTAAGVQDLDDPRREKLQQLLDVDLFGVSTAYLPKLLDDKVEAILSLIWPDLRDAAYNRCREAVDLYENEETILGYNAARQPFLEVMVGGMPALTDRLAKRLKDLNCRPLYAISNRVSHERALPNGTVQKISEFQHLGFIPV